MSGKKITAPDVAASKGERKLAMVTAYDYSSALLADKSGVDMILVGDSLAMVVLGHEDTLSVTMDEMIHHVRAVTKGAKRALVVADMPFLSFQAGVESAVMNAGRFLKEGRAQAVKAEGGRSVIPQIEAMVRAGIPVMGHLGLTPQHIAALGGFKVQSKTARAAILLIEEALALAEAGCFALVLEAIPAEAAAEVTARLPIPTIGIGAGPACDGQVLVYHDILGLYDRFKPKFVKQYADASSLIAEALTRYASEVRLGAFPGTEHSFTMTDQERAAFKEELLRKV
jgi:3-methyl-2-oxobutanoate hydroxymethyltransferase